VVASRRSRLSGCAYPGAAFDRLRAQPGCGEAEAFIEPANAASIRLAMRLGLRATGTFSDGAARYAMFFEESRC
tara:strand:+ start:5574 stop:5795 length:222 start_codon:yes stop_codon:yes gene_type:complete